jgi:hypothetical protein
VHALKKGGMPGVPELLFERQEGRFLVIGETVLAGEPVWSVLNPGNYREIALKVTGWLIGLAGDPPFKANPTWREAIARPALSAFNSSFGPALDPEAVEQTQALLDRLGNLPRVCEQRDCSPWNLMIDKQGNLIVLDWESAELNGLPALDLIYFLTHLAFIQEGAMGSRRYRESYRRMQDPSTFTGRVQAECFRRYTDCLGLKPDCLHPLRLLTWLIHSRSEHRRLLAYNGSPPGPDRLRDTLFYQLWEEELRSCS